MTAISTAVAHDLKAAAADYNEADSVALYHLAVATVAAFDTAVGEHNGELSQNDFQAAAAVLFASAGIEWAAGATSVGNLLRYGRRVVEDATLSEAAGQYWHLGRTAVMAAVASPALNRNEVVAVLEAMTDAQNRGEFRANKAATYIKAAKAAKAGEAKEAKAADRQSNGLTVAAARKAVKTAGRSEAKAKASKADAKREADAKAAAVEAKAVDVRLATARIGALLQAIGLAIDTAADLAGLDAKAFNKVRREAKAIKAAADAHKASAAKAAAKAS